ncbi:hypothetical protein WAI91_20240, partial [Acinetobacter baumannii]
VPHIANGDIPKTLLATSAQLVEYFTKEELSILQREIFEMRAGGKLLWTNEEIRKMKIIELPIEFEFNGQKQCIYPSLIILHNELTLVDTGYPSFLPLIENAILKHGYEMKNLKNII